MKDRNQDDGPRRFIRNWLSFDEQRPVRHRLVWPFVAAVVGLLVASALLAAFGRHP
jgi:hypothetical protein